MDNYNKNKEIGQWYQKIITTFCLSWSQKYMLTGYGGISGESSEIGGCSVL